MNWVRGTGSPWNMHWVQQMDRQEWDLYEDDRTGAMWVEREYGTVLAMLSDGGWRMTKNGAPYRSRYRVFEIGRNRCYRAHGCVVLGAGSWWALR